MREYTGPVPSQQSAQAPSRPREERGWYERDDLTPCVKCGQLLLTPYVRRFTLGGKPKTQLLKTVCRNECPQA